ncbi:hypothetical protein Suden_0804 [Sulfurimonas denitrificans DSM 1251]|uniref:HTH cro/C1-type domain-containing protein n=1 Tax=Sulfurimonas denitrificans (strain ATCC 33889 / DSM 1251) TaxID=326298 RepID=Q30SE8_SULDN|nr:helix-turn-helix domain-containing protein [Sulfurimonas denitrificans]ABB44083.1 hypothetical protein Suden_0804 [Sulfurimonas denitrificans DSM 1251]
MSDFLIVLEKIKLFTNTSSDKDVAEKLGVKPDTLSQWKKRNKIPYSELCVFANLYNVDLNWLLLSDKGTQKISLPDYLIILVNKSYELNRIGLTENLLKFIFESSIKQKLRSYDKSVPFLKYLFWDRYDTLANFRLMMRALKKFKKGDVHNLKIEDSKAVLIDLIKNYQLTIGDRTVYTIRNKDKKNTLKWLEDTFDDLEAYAILMDMELAIKAFDEAKEWLSINLPILKIKGEEV